MLISLLQCKLRPDLEFFVDLRRAYNVTCDDIYAFLVYYVLITMSSCASVLYAVPADRKKNCWDLFPYWSISRQERDLIDKGSASYSAFTHSKRTTSQPVSKALCWDDAIIEFCSHEIIIKIHLYLYISAYTISSS